MNSDQDIVSDLPKTCKTMNNDLGGDSVESHGSDDDAISTSKTSHNIRAAYTTEYNAMMALYLEKIACSC